MPPTAIAATAPSITIFLRIARLPRGRAAGSLAPCIGAALVSHGPGVIPGVVIIPDVVVVLLLGAGTATIGLTPPLLSSVAPSGIVPPLRMVDVAPGLDSGEAVPLEDKAADDDDAQPDIKPVDPIDPVVPTPPPSKVEL